MSQLLYKIETAGHRLFPHWLFNPRYCRVYQLLCNSLKSKSHTFPDITYRWATQDDHSALNQRTALSTVRLRAGDRAAVVMKGEQLIGTLWIAQGVYHDWDTGLKIGLAPDEAWLYGAWIHRMHRGNHLYSPLIAFVGQSLQQEACQSMLFAIDWSNGHSQRIHVAYGATQIGYLVGIYLCGKSLFRLHRHRLEDH